MEESLGELLPYGFIFMFQVDKVMCWLEIQTEIPQRCERMDSGLLLEENMPGEKEEKFIAFM